MNNTKWYERANNVVFVLTFLVLLSVLGWLSTRFEYSADWTIGNRNTLSEESQRVLLAIDKPIEAIAFVVDDAELHKRIKQRVARYQRYKPDLALRFVNPDLDPEQAQQFNITHSGQIVLRLAERREIVDDMGEQTITNALQRLTRQGERWVVFLEGHGEPSPFDDGDHGLSRLHAVLANSGFQLQALNLIRTPSLPDNTNVLVLAAPQRDLLPGEVQVIREHVENGGNLLWLHEPGELHGLQQLTELLDIRFIDGVIVDANPQLRLILGIQHPAVVPVVDYPLHPVTEHLESQTLFPFAAGVEVSDEHQGWISEVVFTSLPQAWAETGSLGGDSVHFEPEEGDRQGPLNIGLSLKRQYEEREQRVLIVGDSDFASNRYLGYGGNLELASNIINWLSADDDLIAINPKSAPDTQLELSDTLLLSFALGFLAVIPLTLIGSGFFMWFNRRKL